MDMSQDCALWNAQWLWHQHSVLVVCAEGDMLDVRGERAWGLEEHRWYPGTLRRPVSREQGLSVIWDTHPGGCFLFYPLVFWCDLNQCLCAQHNWYRKPKGSYIAAHDLYISLSLRTDSSSYRRSVIISAVSRLLPSTFLSFIPSQLQVYIFSSSRGKHTEKRAVIVTSSEGTAFIPMLTKE